MKCISLDQNRYHSRQTGLWEKRQIFLRSRRSPSCTQRSTAQHKRIDESVTDLQGRLKIVHATVVFSTEYTLHILDDVIRSASKGTPGSGENGDQFDLIAGEMVYEFHGKDFAQDCSRKAQSGKCEVLFGNGDEMFPDNEAYIDDGGISQSRVFENKGANKGKIHIRSS